jgi:hypothetical protein
MFRVTGGTADACCLRSLSMAVTALHASPGLHLPTDRCTPARRCLFSRDKAGALPAERTHFFE